MLRRLFALTDEGMKAFRKGVCVCAIANLVLMTPIAVFYLVTAQFLDHLEDPAVALPEMWPYILGIIIVLALVFATQYWEYSSTYGPVYQESARKRIGIAERLRMLPLSFFGDRDLSDLTNVIMKDCADQELLFSHTMPQLFGLSVTTVIVAVGLFFFDWRLAIASLWPIPFAIIIMSCTAKAQANSTKQKNAAALTMTDGIQEYLEGNREIRSLNQVDKFLDKLDSSIDDFERAKIRAELTMGVCVSSSQGLMRLGIATTILVGTLLMTQGTCSLLTFFCFMLVITRLYDPINLVLQSIAEIIDMRQSLARMNAIEEEPMQTGSLEFKPAGHDIVFDDVSFSYKDGEKVLDQANFVAKEGEVTALVGPSGSGKSTAAKLAARFWDVDSGSISVGGVDVSSVDPETLLTNYTEVFQDVVLFDNTVLENIRLGRMDATDEEVKAAAHAAMCDEFVGKLPEGYDTMIGENGSRLSGGERQRISIARAILKDAPIVLLDEATASLDVENETQVQKALSRLLVGKTVLVIAHRMRTVANADKIVVLSEGKIVEQGKPSELLSQDGAFSRMVKLQNESLGWAI